MRQQDDLARVSSSTTFTQTYAQIYALCHHQQQQQQHTHENDITTTKDNNLTDAKRLSNLLTTCATEFSDCRGLEDRTVPVLGLQRRVARAKLIRAG